ncbi:COMM domain-containing protein 3-like [Balamuthia mandrillaris]
MTSSTTTSGAFDGSLCLGEEALAGLDLLADDSHLSDKDLAKVIKAAIKILLARKKEGLNSKDFEVDPLVLKQGYAAVVSLLLEATRTNADATTLQSVLAERNMTERRIALLTEGFESHKAQLKQLLSCTSFHFPHVVDTKWRLDYCIKSRNVERLNSVLYHITLKTEAGSGDGRQGEAGHPHPQDVRFTCSLEELQDLVYKLRDACKQTENHYQRMLQ